MTEKDFTVIRDESGVYHINGQLSIYQVDKLKDFLDDVLRARTELSLSLANVTFIDTAALQLLIAFRSSIQGRVKFQITSVSSEIEKMLTLSGLGAALLGQAI